MAAHCETKHPVEGEDTKSVNLANYQYVRVVGSDNSEHTIALQPAFAINSSDTNGTNESGGQLLPTGIVLSAIR